MVERSEVKKKRERRKIATTNCQQSSTRSAWSFKITGRKSKKIRLHLITRGQFPPHSLSTTLGNNIWSPWNQEKRTRPRSKQFFAFWTKKIPRYSSKKIQLLTNRALILCSGERRQPGAKSGHPSRTKTTSGRRCSQHYRPNLIGTKENKRNQLQYCPSGHAGISKKNCSLYPPETGKHQKEKKRYWANASNYSEIWKGDRQRETTSGERIERIDWRRVVSVQTSAAPMKTFMI